MSENMIADTLRDKVKLKISVIGCGNAGNQLVECAYKNGYENVFAVNSSSKDMDNDVLNANINCFLIGNDGRGAGMNRDAAKELFKMNFRQLFDNMRFKQICDDSDVIFVGASCSGGTGSAISPVITKALKQLYPGKIVVFYGILPRLTASDVELSNSAACISEIEDLNKGDNSLGIPYLLADLNYYEGVSNEEAFVKVVEKMVSDIKVFAGEYLHYSKYRMIDENDMKVIVSPAGYQSIYKLDNITQQMIDKESIQSMLIKQIKHSPAVDIARDGLVDQMAFIYSIPEDMMDGAKSGDYAEITNYVGRPLGVFENYAVVRGGTAQVILILSGQSFPISHMTQINEIIKKGAESRRQKMEARKTSDASMDSTYKFLQNSSVSNANLTGKATQVDESTKNDILGNLF